MKKLLILLPLFALLAGCTNQDDTTDATGTDTTTTTDRYGTNTATNTTTE